MPNAFHCLTCKHLKYYRLCGLWHYLPSFEHVHLPFQQERLNMNWNGNFDSSVGKSARLVIWRSEVLILALVQIFLLKSKNQDIGSWIWKLKIEIDWNDSLSIEHKEEIHIVYESMDLLINSIINNNNNNNNYYYFKSIYTCDIYLISTIF